MAFFFQHLLKEHSVNCSTGVLTKALWGESISLYGGRCGRVPPIGLQSLLTLPFMTMMAHPSWKKRKDTDIYWAGAMCLVLLHLSLIHI